MKKFQTRLLIFFLSILIVITSIAPVFAEVNAQSLLEEKKELINKNSSIDSKTMQQKFPLSKAYLDRELNTAKDSSKKIFVIQFEDGKKNECIRQLEKIPGLEIKYQYDSIFEGVSVKVDSNQISRIRDIKGVKNIQENGTFEPQIASAKQMTKVKEAVNYYDEVLGKMSDEEKKAKHLDGRGTVVAVIDSGIDINHESMKIDDDAKKYIKVQPDDGFTTKVPHGFSYVGGGNDLMDKVTAGHGMHCAGIIAGNGEKFKGVVPNAQIFAYRIFSDSYYPEEDFRRYEYGGDDSVYHAIDDAVKHGADVISMSIGQAGNGYAGDLYYETVNRAADKGVVIVSAIGNYGSSASENTYDSNPLNNLGLTNTSAMTYYAGIDRILAVGSTTNSNKTTKQIKIDDSAYSFTTLGNKDANESVMKNNKGDMELVFVGHGRKSAYDELQKKNISVKDKVVVALRDGARTQGSRIIEKINIAADNGAKGIIIMNSPISFSRDNYMDYTITSYENDPEMTSTVKDKNIWAISVNGRDGESIKQFDNKKVKIDFPEDEVVSPINSEVRMSGFSGWGPNAELELKPEIVAPGENIFSTMNRNRYGFMSGTSMATPHVSGISAMLVQKVKSLHDKDLFKDMKNSDINKIILMNTAVPIKDYINKDIESSPRRQGAGMVQADRAIKNDVFVTYNKKAAVELKDFKEDSKGFTLRIDNTSNKSKSYDINYSDVIGEGVTVQQKLVLAPDKIKQGEFTDTFDKEDVKVTVPTKLDAKIIGEKSVTIPANSHVELSFVLNTNKVKDHFVEGYIYFNPKNVEDTQISIPYIGYKGDWQDGAIIDKPMWDKDSLFKHTTVVGIYPDDGHGEDIEYKILGVDEDAFETIYDEKRKQNVKDEEKLKEGYQVDPDKISFSTGFMAAQPKAVTLRLVALREAKDLEVAILNSDHQVVRVVSRSKNYRKQIHNVIFESDWQRKVFHRPNILFTWDGTLYDAKSGEMVNAPDGQYYYRIRAKVKDTDKFEETILPVKVDSTSPHEGKIEYTFNEDGSRDVKLNISDENGIKFVGASLDNKPLKVEKVSNNNYIIKNLKVNEFTNSHLHIEAMDYANNLMDPIEEDLNENASASVKFYDILEANEESIKIKINDSKIKSIKAYQYDDDLKREEELWVDKLSNNEYELNLSSTNSVIVEGFDSENKKITTDTITLSGINSPDDNKIEDEKTPNGDRENGANNSLGAKDYIEMTDEELDEFAKAFDFGFDNYYILTASNQHLTLDDGQYYFNPDSDDDSWYHEFDRDTELDEDDYKLVLTAYNTNKKGHEDYQPTWTKEFDSADGHEENLNIPVSDGVNILNITAIEKETGKIAYSRGILIMLDTKKPELQFEGAMFDTDKKIVYANGPVLNVKGTVKDNLDEVYLDINGDNIVTKSKWGDWGNNETAFEQKINVKDGDILTFKTKDRFQNHDEIKYTVKIDTEKPTIEFDQNNLTKDSILEPNFDDNIKIAEKLILVNGKPYEKGRKLSEYGSDKFIIELKAIDKAGNITEKTIGIGTTDSDTKITDVKLSKSTFTKDEVQSIRNFVILPQNTEILEISNIDLEKENQEITISVKNNLGVKENFKFNIKISDTTVAEISKIDTNKNFLPEELTRENLIDKLPQGVTIVPEPIDATKPGPKDLVINFIKDSSIIEKKIYKINILPELDAKLNKTRFSTEEITDIEKVVKPNDNFKYEFISSPSTKTGEQEIKIKISDNFNHTKEMTFKVSVYEKQNPKPRPEIKDEDILPNVPKEREENNNSSHRDNSVTKINKIHVENSNKQYNPVVENKKTIPSNDATKVFTDIENHWAKDYILKAVADKIVSGYPDNTFRPQNNTTRAEFASLANRIFGYTNTGDIHFKDIAEDAWYKKDVECLAAEELLFGDENNNFKPEDKITREQIASIFVRYIEKVKPELLKEVQELPFKDKEKVSDWALEDIKKAYTIGIINGNDKNMLNPTDKATRAEVVVMVYNLKNILK